MSRLAACRLVAVLMIIGLGAFALGDTQAPAGQEGPEAVWSAYYAAAQKGEDCRQYLSKRLQNVITPEVEAGLKARVDTVLKQGHSVRVTVVKGSPKVLESTATTAVIQFQDDLNASRGRPPHRAYLIKENGRWVMDETRGITPEWAVPADRKSEYLVARNLLIQYDSIRWSGDASVVSAFIRAHFSRESAAELSGPEFITLMSKAPKRVPLRPPEVAVGPAYQEGGVSYFEVGYGTLDKWVDEHGKLTYSGGIGRMTFVHEDGDWKMFLSLGDPDLLVPRFLDLWQEGQFSTMGYLMAPDARVSLLSGAPKGWSAVEKTVPRLAVPPMMRHPGVRMNGFDVVDADMPFVGSSKLWPSGRYRFEIGFSTVFGLRCFRITSISFLQTEKLQASAGGRIIPATRKQSVATTPASKLSPTQKALAILGADTARNPMPLCPGAKIQGDSDNGYGVRLVNATCVNDSFGYSIDARPDDICAWYRQVLPGYTESKDGHFDTSTVFTHGMEGSGDYCCVEISGNADTQLDFTVESKPSAEQVSFCRNLKLKGIPIPKDAKQHVLAYLCTITESKPLLCVYAEYTLSESEKTAVDWYAQRMKGARRVPLTVDYTTPKGREHWAARWVGPPGPGAEPLFKLDVHTHQNVTTILVEQPWTGK